MIDKRIISLGGEPIFVINTDFRATQEELDYIISLDGNPPNEWNKQHPGSFTSTDSAKILEATELHRIKTEIIKYFNEYVTEVLCIRNQFIMSHSWATYNKEGTKHHNHHHPNTIFSGVYYPKAKDCHLKFVIDRASIRRGFALTYDVIKPNEFNQSTVPVPTDTGTFIFFPSHVRHGTSVHTSEKICIGTQYFPSGWFGDEPAYNLVEFK